MSSPSDSGLSFYILVLSLLLGIPALVVWILVFAPPFFANREVRSIMDDVAAKYAASSDDGFILGQINQRLKNIRTSQFEVDDNNAQKPDEVLQLTADELTVTHDSNEHLTLDADYDQTVLVPILGRIQVYHYHDHSETPTP